mgnify:CR=1 FL=1
MAGSRVIKFRTVMNDCVLCSDALRNGYVLLIIVLKMVVVVATVERVVVIETVVI